MKLNKYFMKLKTGLYSQNPINLYVVNLVKKKKTKQTQQKK